MLSGKKLQYTDGTISYVGFPNVDTQRDLCRQLEACRIGSLYRGENYTMFNLLIFFIVASAKDWNLKKKICHYINMKTLNSIYKEREVI